MRAQWRGGRLDLAMPGGDVVRLGGAGPAEARARIHDDRLWLRMLLRGEMGAGESFVAGEWSADDLAGVLRLFLRGTGARGVESPITRLAQLPALRRHRRAANTRDRQRAQHPRALRPRQRVLPAVPRRGHARVFVRDLRRRVVAGRRAAREARSPVRPARAVAARPPARDRLRLGRHGDPRRADARLPRHGDHGVARAARARERARRRGRARRPRRRAAARLPRRHRQLRQARLDRDGRGGRLRRTCPRTSRRARACCRAGRPVRAAGDHHARRPLRALSPRRRLDADVRVSRARCIPSLADPARRGAGARVRRGTRHRPGLRADAARVARPASSPRCPRCARSASTSRSCGPGCSTSRSARRRSRSARSATTSSCS